MTTLILIFAIFQKVYSIFFAVSRVRFTGDGLKFRYVGFRNFKKLFFGSSEVQFLGRTDPVSIFGYVIFIIILITYLAYFKKDENIVLIEKKNNEILEDTSENLISDLFYQSEDNDGNRYEIKSKNGILSQKRANLISMKDVSATVFLIDGGKIFIVSDSAEYDSLSLIHI